MKIDLKKLLVPFTNQTKLVDAVQLWEVRWMSRYDEYSHSVSTAVEWFPSEEAAQEFRQAVINAFSLIRHTGPGTEVAAVRKV